MNKRQFYSLSRLLRNPSVIELQQSKFKIFLTRLQNLVKLAYWRLESRYSRIKHRIGIFIDYAPVLWNDHDWDHSYFLILMRKKLSRMEYTIRNGMHVYANRDADQIKRCILLLDRLIKDDYFEYEIKGDDLYIKNVPFGWDHKKTYEHEEYLRKQDQEYLFKYMNKHLRGWWD